MCVCEVVIEIQQTICAVKNTTGDLEQTRVEFWGEALLGSSEAEEDLI